MRTLQINTGEFIINGAAMNYAKMIIMVGKGCEQRTGWKLIQSQDLQSILRLKLIPGIFHPLIMSTSG